MISIRRLRAVLVFATISAVAWALLGTLVTNTWLYLTGQGNMVGRLGLNQFIYAAFGFVAGTTWAVTIAALPRKDDQSVTPLSAALAGALGGMLVIGGLLIAIGDVARQGVVGVLLPLGVAGSIGATVGLLIQRTASRGHLPAPKESPKVIEG